MGEYIELKPHYVKSCVFWETGCKCNSRLNRDSGQVWCGGKDKCDKYEWLAPWKAYMRRLGKGIPTKEGHIK